MPMSAVNPIPASRPLDAEEPAQSEPSTAPTTPEGSLSFSPVLRPRNGANLDIDTANLVAVSRNSNRSLSSALLDNTATPPPVRTICCVGAGYVGKSLPLSLWIEPQARLPLSTLASIDGARAGAGAEQVDQRMVRLT